MRDKFFDYWLFSSLLDKVYSVHHLICNKNLYLSVFFASVWWVGGVQAKEIYIEPSINIETKYDDNIKLIKDRFKSIDTSAYGVITRANAKIGVRSDRYDVELDNEVVINQYFSNLDNLNSEDVFVNFSSNFDATEKNRLSLTGNYTRDTTLTSELNENETGTGVVEDNPIRDEWSVSPTWTYFLSNTQFLQANYTHSEISYEKSDFNNFFDYTIDNFSLSYSQQWLPVLRNFFNVSVMSFEVSDINRDTLEYRIDTGVEYQISPTWFASMTVGGRFTSTDITIDRPSFINGAITTEKVKISDDTQGMIFSLNMNKQFEKSNAGIGYSRSTNPQGDGRLQLLDRFDANFSHRFTHRLHFSLTGLVSVSSNSGSKDTGNDRTNYSVRPTISWMFDRNIRLTGGYRYRRQEFERNDDLAESNTVFLNINYQWDKFATQRY